MQLSNALKVGGTSLVVIGTMIHIICLSTPNWVEADLTTFKNAITRTQLGPDFIRQASVKVTFGLWETCVDVSMKSLSFDVCLKWGGKGLSDLLPPLAFDTPGWIEGAQAMNILGLLAGVGTIVLAVITLLYPSQKERKRLLLVFSCIACIVTGVVILIGDIVMASEYKTVVSLFLNGIPNQDFNKRVILSKLEGIIHLSWGFAMDIVVVNLFFVTGIFYLIVWRKSQCQESGMA